MSFEPLLGDIVSIDLRGMKWVIIGAETGNRKDKVDTKAQWIGRLTAIAKSTGIPVFHKDNVKSHVPEWFELFREFPKGESK